MKADVSDGVMEESLKTYRTSLESLDYEGAVMAGERLMEADCSVCQRIGQHLAAMGVALSTAPSAEVESSLREEGIRTAERLEADLV